jgi:MFS transporter, putative metabolite:H+ symporter
MWELLERQERLTSHQWKIIAAAILGVALGSLTFFLASFGLGFARASQHLGYAQSPLIQLSAGSGGVLGPIFWGWMADRVGRRTAFIAAVLNASLASGIMAVTPDQGGLIFLTTFFFFTAFGSSGLIITILPLVQEFVPASKRGWISGMVIALIALLAFAPALGTRLAVHVSWRALFALGLLPALLTLLIRAWVPESPRWLVRNGLLEDARRSLAWALRVAPDKIDLPALLPKMEHMPWHELFRHRRSVAITCAISLIQIGGAGVALSSGVFFSILKIGASSVVYLTLGLALAGLAGQFVMSYLSDAIGRRGSGMLCGFSAALGFTLAGYYYGAFFGTVSVFWLLMMVASFFGLGSMAIVRPYTAEVWPAGLRASGMGLASGFGSLCGLLTPPGLEMIIGAPNFLSPQATPDSVLPATLLLATWSALAGLVFWLFAIETRGRSIEEIDAALAIAMSRAQ